MQVIWVIHAGIGETSLLWHLEPHLVAIARIRNDPEYEKNNHIEKESSPGLGQKYTDLITKRLGCLAKSMPKWTEEKRTDSITAERSILSARQYGKLPVEEKFDQIMELSKQLKAKQNSNG